MILYIGDRVDAEIRFKQFKFTDNNNKIVGFKPFPLPLPWLYSLLSQDNTLSTD